jgi:hypothetical protein
MIDTLSVTIPQENDETARAYAARVIYLTMGPSRSLEKIRGQSVGNVRVTNRLATLEEWSVRYNWVESSRRYDQILSDITIQEAAATYRKDLEEHRAKTMKAGGDLFTVAQALLVQCGRAIRGQQIEGKDGKLYTIPAMELTPTTLATAARALTTALDLEAHALRIADLLPKLSTDESDSQ